MSTCGVRDGALCLDAASELDQLTHAAGGEMESNAQHAQLLATGSKHQSANTGK